MADPTFHPMSDAEFVRHVAILAGAIVADEGWRPDFVVGIGRGGLVPATYLSHATAIPMLSIDMSAGVAEFGDALLAALAARTRTGDRLLFVDDINDTGRTIDALRAALDAAGAVLPQVRFAVLIDNVRSSARVEHRARTIDRTVTKDWFVFPWEAVASPAAIVADAAEMPERTA